MLTSKLQDAINRQINSELYSAHLYLSMAAFFETISLTGFASWMKIQHQEEDRPCPPSLRLRQRQAWARGSPCRRPAPNRVRVAAQRHAAGARTRAGSDEDDQQPLRAGDRRKGLPVARASRVVRRRAGGREEKTLTDIVDHLNLIGDDGTGLLIMDERLGSRTAADGGAASE